MVLSNSNETIPDSVTFRNSAECEFWDKYLQPLRNVKSQEFSSIHLIASFASIHLIASFDIIHLISFI